MDKRTRYKTKKAIEKIIRQGYNNDTQELFHIIFEVMREEFTEDNFPTRASFMLENTIYSLKPLIKSGVDVEWVVKLIRNIFDQLKKELLGEVEEMKKE